MRKRFLKIMTGGVASLSLATSMLVGCPATAVAQSAHQTAGSISGQVVDNTGEPMIGATVTVKGTKEAVACDLDGNFTIKAAPGATLVVSYVGYKPAEVKAANGMTITMQEDSEVLSDVVVVGFGTAKKETLTGAVSVVDAAAFKEKGNLSSPLQALQGQVPGVIITRSSSAPGDESWGMSLRGSSSINSAEPLIIIDGVASESVNDMRLLNSNDIESINFLKDGAAAIYGSRAAGGVVLITTKKGAAGKVKVEYNGSATLRRPGMMPELMEMDEWMQGLETVLRNDNNTGNPWYTYAQLAQKYKGGYIDLEHSPSPFGNGAFTDVADFVFDDEVNWMQGLFGDAWSTEHNLSVSGGTEQSKYRVSGAYMYDGSTLQFGKNNNQRFNIRFNNQYQFSQRVRLESVIAYNRQEQVVPTMIGAALTVNLPMPGLPMRNLNGQPYAWGTWGSPVAKVEEGGDNKLTVSAINISETLNVDITDWLTANVNLGYNTSNAWRDIYQNAITFYNYTGTKAISTNESLPENTYSRSTSSRTDFYSATGYLNATRTFAQKHNLSLMLGVQYEFKDFRQFGVNAKEIQAGLEVVNGAGEITLNSVNRWQESNLSYFGRFNYDFDGRYLLEFNGRYDGSSKFQPENRWEFFYGVSAGWRISQEAFLRDLTWLSNLKIRASYSEMGNQSGIGRYDGVQLYNFNSNNGAYLGSNKVTTITTNGEFASTSRHWERIKNFNVGLDFSLLNGSITGQLDYFEKHNDNMLVAVTYPATLGDKAPSANAGKFKGWGYEGQLTYNGRAGDVRWHVGGTLTFARNELTDFGGTNILSSGYRATQQGYPLYSIFGLRYGGKIANEEMLNAYLTKYYDGNGIGMPQNLRVGDNMYCDENGDGVLDEKDYIYLGSDSPEISYSFNFGASWKGLDLSVIFQGAANRFIYRDIDNQTVPFRALYTNTGRASIGNVWSPETPDNYYNPYTTDGGINNYNYQASSLTAQDGRYLRLKNITLGYSLPSQWLTATKCLSGVRVYVSGSDLWETTKLKDGWDPEAKRGGGGTARYPFTRNWTFGLNLTF
ncbi:MAG TPA: SusC/RagA family TonB-linked outer membrane protein [Porphyromonadaceae bacterium]|nr:SusC/RagA family TonB-linked outer membrane protein [Porphyromonadaceae bacterium]